MILWFCSSALMNVKHIIGWWTELTCSILILIVGRTIHVGVRNKQPDGGTGTCPPG